ncbi:MAG: hypothetical protein COA38_03385 [Fluviicola sp.]|nr:MAG: hypothetical protein COA38_03385 [Fluviicola sp.]
MKQKMQNEFIELMNDKYGGKIFIDQFKKTHTYFGEIHYGKLQTQVDINGVTVLFTYNASNESMPYSTSIVLRSKLPCNLQLLPRNKFIWWINGKKSNIFSRYKIKIDDNLKLSIDSNNKLCSLILKNTITAATTKRENFRVFSISPNFSILTLNDYIILEEITMQFVNCMFRPQLHGN